MNKAEFICVGGPKDGDVVAVNMDYEPEQKLPTKNISQCRYEMTDDYQDGYRVLQFMRDL
jgi:hypothetical protein